MGKFLERKLEDLERAMNQDGDLDRRRVNTLLRQLFRGVTVSYRSGTLEFEWLHGGWNEVMFAWPEEEDVS